MIVAVKNETEMRAFGVKLGKLLDGGDVVELVGDIGAGKTTLTKGIAHGLGVDEEVQSPSFTISRLYDAGHGRRFAHYDFYRLHDSGIMAHDLHEATGDPLTVTVIEWANIVEHVLPAHRLTIGITSPSETVRRLELSAAGDTYQTLLGALA